ncbi:uncharacterized protein N7503_006047 [Penicillium pulvis]|uniref:uncharacterized protein n=1 Tax=Penicillium pulvis TaxID=1562058 RepID=UPI002548F93B|nr:uncharacterized protein N7503_006047 [Penicillium pulvis]KAJ5803597.1 hypothetical protein N7503_006047 [Penicillium pulvis]
MAISRPCEPLLLAEPDENDPLPCDDTLWIQQENPMCTESSKDWVMPMERQTSIQLTLLSPVTSRMGGFQLLVHATYLLSKAIQCASERQQGLQISDERYVQLIRTVEALMTVLEIERQSAIVAVGMPRNILNSTIFLIYSLLRDAENPLVAQLEHPRELSATFYLERTRAFLDGNLGDVRIAPPFILQWGFRVIQYYSDKYKLEGHYESLKATQDIERFFEIFDQRWKIAGQPRKGIARTVVLSWYGL